MPFDVLQDGGTEWYLPGEADDERVLGGHCLQIADAVCQPSSGGAGEDEQDAGEDGVPAQPCRAGGGGSAAADGLGFVLEEPGVVDQFHGQAFAAHGGAVDFDERVELAPVLAFGGGVVEDGVGDEAFAFADGVGDFGGQSQGPCSCPSRRASVAEGRWARTTHKVCGVLREAAVVEVMG